MKIFYHNRYIKGARSFVLMQDYMVRPYLFFVSLLGGLLLYLLANRQSLVYPGLIGIFIVIVFGQLFGTMNAKRKYMEIGFDENFFYMRSAYDLAYNKNLRFYPLSYANAVRQGDHIFVNYIDHTIRLNRDEWEQWTELWMAFNEQPSGGNISVS